ncbi:MAG: hypothetical protein K5900_12595 [Butyrivibrio sp.]|nr:hypothetical protein [Butyrivibrio sp.]
MRKITTVITATILMGAMCACSSETTSYSEVTYTETTDEGTTEYKKTTENNNGNVTTETTVTETPAEADDTSEAPEDFIRYNVSDGVLYCEALSADDYWWEVYQFENSTKLVDWEIEDNTYYASVEANMLEGTGYVIFAAYDNMDTPPVQYAVAPVEIRDNEIVGVYDGEYVDDLDDYFPIFEYGFMAQNEAGQNALLFAIYRSYDKNYAYVMTNKNYGYVDYTTSSVTINDANGNSVEGVEIVADDVTMYYYEQDGNCYVLDEAGTVYNAVILTENEVEEIRSENET